MKHLFFILLLVASAQVAMAQQTTVLKPGQRGVPRHSSANRPDVLPKFPGGAEALGEFLQMNIQYPEAARAKGVTGQVLMGFRVEADGRVTDPHIIQGLTPECDAEALRVLQMMPAWLPAKRKGETLAMPVQLPFTFGSAANLEIEKGKVKFE